MMNVASIYEFTVEKPDGTLQSMKDFEGSVAVIVNTASKCGFTDQFKELQEIYEDYREQGFTVLGFPSDNFMNQEFDSIEKTMAFCEMNYGVTFPMFAKVDVIGNNATPLFSFLDRPKEGFASLKESNGISRNSSLTAKGMSSNGLLRKLHLLKCGKQLKSQFSE